MPPYWSTEYLRALINKLCLYIFHKYFQIKLNKIDLYIFLVPENSARMINLCAMGNVTFYRHNTDFLKRLLKKELTSKVAWSELLWSGRPKSVSASNRGDNSWPKLKKRRVNTNLVPFAVSNIAGQRAISALSNIVPLVISVSICWKRWGFHLAQFVPSVWV